MANHTQEPESTNSARQRRPRIEWFEAVLAYRRWHTIAEASRRLGVSQDLLSERIRLLEEWFGQDLFERSQPHQRLTPRMTVPGERHLPYMQQIVAAFDDLLTTLTVPVTRGQIVVALPESLATGLLAEVRSAMHERGMLPPGGWRFFTARSSVVRNEVIHKRAALGLLIERDPFTDRELTVEPIARSPMCLFVGARHRLAGRTEPITLDELRDEVFVLDKEHSTYRAIFEGLLRRANIAIQRRDAFSNIEAVKSAVAAGPGVALLPYFALAHDVEAGELVIVPLAEEPVYVQILLAHHPDNRLEQPALREICNEFRRRALLLPQPAVHELVRH
jgi:LysR family hydrogen peroxide-inducible transcriptional activator